MPATPAVEQLEGRVISPYDRFVGQYRELAAVADQEVFRRVIGYPPAGTDEAKLYLFLVRWVSPSPMPSMPRMVRKTGPAGGGMMLTRSL